MTNLLHQYYDIPIFGLGSGLYDGRIPCRPRALLRASKYRKISKKGVEKVIELDLSEEEQKQFNHSVQTVKKLFETAKKIDNSLN